jgi:hypothetical protein
MGRSATGEEWARAAEHPDSRAARANAARSLRGKIGKVDELSCDKDGGQPEWALVSAGLLGTRKTFVPIQQAAQSGDDAQVPFARQQVKDAPKIETDRDLSEEEERRLYQHHGVPYTSEGTTTAKGFRRRGRDLAGRRHDPI